MPTAPVDHDWEASHPITRHRSACSLAGYSSTATPSDDPVPRRSTRTTAYPYSPHSRSYSGRYDAVASSLRYGSASSTTGTFPPDRVPSGRNRLAASRTPSSIGIQLRRSTMRTRRGPAAGGSWRIDAPPPLTLCRSPWAVTPSRDNRVMRRAYKFRAYPTRRQEQRARALLDAHRHMYNAALEERREAWRHGMTIRHGDQSAQLAEIRRADPDGQGRWSFTSQQQTLRRLDRAFQGFFQRVRAGRRAGYPRFKTAARWTRSTLWTVTVPGGATLRAGGRWLTFRASGR